MTKAEMFRVFYKKFYKIAESGSWNDLVGLREDFYKAAEEGKFYKSDLKILEKADVYAEKQIKVRRNRKS